MDQPEEKAPQKSEIAQKEEKILEFWKENHIFEHTLAKESPKGEFVFYEGPPTANAAPAIHHLESRAFKDVIPRYKTMRGYHVRRKGGWDTHGLPVELQIEKKLGLKSKKEIESYGIARFNKESKASVWEHIHTWTRFTERIGYWVDNADPYVTYHNSYIESLWNIVAEVSKKNLLYKDYKVVPWCPRCGTALSSHELAQGYEDITDISVYVKFKVVGQENTYILAWTTTPWTLPGNVGLAVGKDIEYVKIKSGEEFLILAKERLSALGDIAYEAVQEMKGSELVGLSYEPLYPFLENLATGEAKEKLPNAFKVYPADFVTTTDGTGVVHTAVMYGQEDFELGTAVGLPKFHLVAPDGMFMPGTGFLAGRYVRETNENGKPTLAVDILDDLKNRNLFFKQENYKHSYPHCWRCKTALIYYARDSWYIRMSSLRAELQAENEKINWEPSHIKDGRFGEWLREAKDWAISRERYWGTPLPVWENADGERVIIGSLDELKTRIGRRNTYRLMRHGGSECNKHGDLVSSVDRTSDPLTQVGREEVQAAAEELKGQDIDLIFASPLLRTRQTAEIVADKLGIGVDKIIFDDRLVEVGGGEFDGKSWPEFLASFANTTERFEKSVGGSETWDSARRRVMEFLYDTDAKHHGKNILVVSHGGPINLMLLGSKGFSKDEMITRYYDYAIRNAEVSKCDFAALPHDDDFHVDLHRPYIDEVTLLSDSGKPLTRTKEVMDVWFDSGAMPFAQDHYPFENKEWVEGPGYPADFISEAIDQTRGWFYTLLAVGVLTGKGTPYKNVICLGHILDSQGKKMSKSIGNIVNPWEQFDKYGVDALRLWMYSVNQPGDSKNYDEKTVDEIVKKVFNPLSNMFSFYAMYENGVERIDPHASTHPLDIWILARLSEMVGSGTAYLDSYKLFESSRIIRDFIQDFSTWYLRRSRDRFKSDDAAEKSWAVSVMEHVLVETAKYLAPFAPFYAEQLYQDVTKGKRLQSVHLESWPEAGAYEKQVLDDMQSVRQAVSSALELRQKAGHKVRQPLASLTIPQQFSQELLDIIADEVNVKEVRSGGELSLDTVLTDELREEGTIRDLIRGIQDARKKEGCNPADTIHLSICAPAALATLIEKYASMIKVPTQVTEMTFVQEPQTHEIALEGGTISLSITK
jgi:isoleucyl-tRNA synthetase